MIVTVIMVIMITRTHKTRKTEQPGHRAQTGETGQKEQRGQTYLTYTGGGGVNGFLNNVENCNIVPGCFPCSQQRTLLLWKVFPQPLFSFEVFHISLSLRIICSEIYITRIENNVPTTLPESNFSYTTRPKSWSKLVREIERRHWTWTS